MDHTWIRDSVERGKIVRLADYRRKLSDGDDDVPPPPPKPARARPPAPLLWADVLAGWSISGGDAEKPSSRGARVDHGHLAA